MRLGIFIGMIFIGEQLAKIAKTKVVYDDVTAQLFATIFIICLIQDIVSIFKKGAV